MSTIFRATGRGFPRVVIKYRKYYNDPLSALMTINY